MIENRPIVAIAIGYIIGIIMGLYCKISIAFLYLIVFFIYLLLKKPQRNKFKLISFKRYFRYVKIVLTKKVLILIIISSIFSNSITILKNNQYENVQNKFDKKEVYIEAIVKSNVKKNKYRNLYKIESIKGNLKIKYLYLYTNKNVNFEYGDIVKINGIFNKPQIRTNYKGFDYSKYLKTKSIYGIIKAKEIKKINEIKFSISKNINSIFLKTKKLIQLNFDEDISNVLLGITLGYTDEMDEEIKNDFSESNISHILAVSGMHIGYILLICKIILEKPFGKRKMYIYTIAIILLYMIFTGLSPSAVRATIMATLMLFSKVIYKKSDIWTNISLSILILLLYNPFLIENVGLILSYIATIGILVYYKNFKNENKILEIIGITLTIFIFIAPIIAMYFNKIPILSLGVSAVIGFIAGLIVIFGFLFICLNSFTLISNLIKVILSIIVKVLIRIANFGSNLPINKIWVTTPSIITIVLYYILLFISLFLFSIFHSKRKTAFNKRIKNLISLLKYRYNQNKKRVIALAIIVTTIFFIIKIIPNNLKIYFIDVGQGDSCLIVTPKNKRILIDGGGSENYDIGKNTLIPYLLARGVKHLDYVVISHFDTDHVGGILTVMQELKVDKAIICRQEENSENYKKFKQIVRNKRIKVIIADKDDKVKIEKKLYIDVLWPNSTNLIGENVLNNNSIVCKLHYNEFLMLFTGDIEEIAEKQILQEYKNNLDILKATVLKVAHHGSKTSSTQEFLTAVKPKMALIGVGENNTFGHPNEEVLKRLENLGTKTYRTDLNGEITITVNKRGYIKVNKIKK